MSAEAAGPLDVQHRTEGTDEMTSFRTSTHRSATSLRLRDRFGCAEVPPPVDTDWVADGSADADAAECDPAAEPGPEVWYG